MLVRHDGAPRTSYEPESDHLRGFTVDDPSIDGGVTWVSLTSSVRTSNQVQHPDHQHCSLRPMAARSILGNTAACTAPPTSRIRWSIGPSSMTPSRSRSFIRPSHSSLGQHRALAAPRTTDATLRRNPSWDYVNRGDVDYRPSTQPCRWSPTHTAIPFGIKSSLSCELPTAAIPGHQCIRDRLRDRVAIRPALWPWTLRIRGLCIFGTYPCLADAG